MHDGGLAYVPQSRRINYCTSAEVLYYRTNLPFMDADMLIPYAQALRGVRA